VSDRIYSVAWILARRGDKDAVEGLLAGVPVPRRRLKSELLTAIDEPLDGPPLVREECVFQLRHGCAGPIPVGVPSVSSPNREFRNTECEKPRSDGASR
jgi:hypothetical protein